MVRSFPFFFCFFSIWRTVTSFPSCQSILHPTARSKHSSSSSGSMRYVFVSILFVKYAFSPKQNASWKPFLPSPSDVEALMSSRWRRIGMSCSWISSAIIMLFWSARSQKSGIPSATTSWRLLKRGAYFLSY